MKQEQKIRKKRVPNERDLSCGVHRTLLLDLVNAERQLRLLGQPDGEELAGRISVFRAKLQEHSRVVAAVDLRKVDALHRLERLLEPEAVRREPGETLFDALVRLYGWHTNDELERMLHSLESGEPG